jgi:hypothetical protein
LVEKHRDSSSLHPAERNFGWRGRFKKTVVRQLEDNEGQVAKGDEHYSPAKIAGYAAIKMTAR